MASTCRDSRQLPRDRILLVDDLADLAVDLAHRFFRHVHRARDRPAEEHFASFSP
jgi:hypothetical protein